MAAFSGLLLAAFVAVVTNSLEVFLVGLAFAFLPLIGVFFPAIVVALFLFLNLLIPKVPLIEIQGYIVPIRIEDVFLACALICLLLRYVIFREKPAPNPLSKWMAIFSVLTCLSFFVRARRFGNGARCKGGLPVLAEGARILRCVLPLSSWGH